MSQGGYVDPGGMSEFIADNQAYARFTSSVVGYFTILRVSLGLIPYKLPCEVGYGVYKKFTCHMRPRVRSVSLQILLSYS